jgi:starvation-inducible DNA-binding protein
MKSSSTNCDSLSHLLIRKRILNKSAAVNDEGSNAMMSDFAEQEKTIWMMQGWKNNRFLYFIIK